MDFIKKKFLKSEQDTPEATMSALATTKPEVLPQYVTAMTEWMKAQTDYFNRDVVGEVSQWVRDLRAVIRPFGVIGAGITLMSMAVASFYGWEPEAGAVPVITGILLSCEGIVSSWFGSRITIQH